MDSAIRANQMSSEYYDTIDHLEKQSVDADYILGWAGGYLDNPAREEQRVTQAYTAGYADGKAGHTEQAEQFTIQ
jgi:hypothetical protein